MGIRSIRDAIVLSSVIVITGPVSGLRAEEISRDYHESFDVRPGMRLRLEHGDGDVSISPWQENTLDISARYRARATTIGWTKTTDFEVEFRQEGDTIVVVGKEPTRVSVGISALREVEYIYTVKAPSYLELMLDGDDGDVEIEEWQGSIEMRLQDGDVRLTGIAAPRTEATLEDGDLVIEELAGELVVDCEDGDVEVHDCRSEKGRIRAEDGDITLDRCAGNFVISTADGDIRLTDLAGQKLEIRSDDGSVDLALLPAETLALEVRVKEGDVRLDLDEAVSATFELETRDGRIRVYAPGVHELREERRRVTGRLGEGEGTIYVRTSDGSVTLRQ